MYGNVEQIEFYPGLFAEDVRRNAALPPLIGRLVAIDAFSQAFTNPLLSPRVFNPQTFSPLGWDLIRTTGSLSDLLHRNIPDSGRRYDACDDASRLGADLSSTIGRGFGPCGRLHGRESNRRPAARAD